MLAYELKKGMIIVIPGYLSTRLGVEVAKVKPGRFKSSIHVSCKGGRDYDITRNTEVYVCPEDMVCDACDKVSDDLNYYDNEIFGHSGWMCSDCISIAETEL